MLSVFVIRKIIIKKDDLYGDFPGIFQRLRFRASTAGGVGSIPGQGTKILQVMWRGQKKKKKEDISGLSEETQMIGVSVLCQMQSVLKAVKFDTCFRKILCVSVHWTPTKCCWRMETEPPLEFLGLSHAQSSRNSPAGGSPGQLSTQRARSQWELTASSHSPRRWVWPFHR